MTDHLAPWAWGILNEDVRIKLPSCYLGHRSFCGFKTQNNRAIRTCWCINLWQCIDLYRSDVNVNARYESFKFEFFFMHPARTNKALFYQILIMVFWMASMLDCFREICTTESLQMILRWVSFYLTGFVRSCFVRTHCCRGLATIWSANKTVRWLVIRQLAVASSNIAPASNAMAFCWSTNFPPTSSFSFD